MIAWNTMCGSEQAKWRHHHVSNFQRDYLRSRNRLLNAMDVVKREAAPTPRRREAS
jgi:hypothetical protein